MDALILAGGRGERLGLDDIPKPMVDFEGTPLIHRQIIELNKCDKIKRVFILSGYLNQIITDYFSKLHFKNLEILHIVEKLPLGTAGAIKQIQNKVSKRFIVLYGDVFFDINIKRFIDFDKKNNCPYGTLFAHPNDHPFDSDLLKIQNNRVVETLPKPHPIGRVKRNIVNAAFYILSTKIFELIQENKKLDLAKDVFRKVPKNGLAAYMSSEFIKDIGTPERLDSVIKLFRKGLISKRNLLYEQKAIFLDRDGVINYEKPPFVNLKNFKIYSDVNEFISFARSKNYLIFIVTNQPSISKGFITFDELDLIHEKLEYHLLKNNLFIDEISFCPHHPESGFKGEIKKLKIKCKCRKPGTKMIIDLINKYNINPKKSYMIGDRFADIKAGKDSKLSTIILDRGMKGDDKKFYPNLEPDFSFQTLIETKIIL